MMPEKTGTGTRPEPAYRGHPGQCRRMAGVVQVIFGLVFVVVAVTQIMPLSPLFSLPFLAMGALAVVMGVLSAVGKNGRPTGWAMTWRPGSKRRPSPV